MRLNKELKTPSKMTKYRLMWVGIYVLIFVLSGVFAYYIMHERAEDHLPSGFVDLKVSSTQYNIGDSIDFTVYNYYPVEIFVLNQCPNEPLHVFKWNENKWEQIHAKADKENSSCSKQSRKIAIPANGSLTYNFNDWPDLFTDPGVYRLVMSVDHSNDLPYQDFRILAPAEIIEQSQEIPPNLPNIEEPSDGFDVHIESERELEHEEHGEADEYEHEEEENEHDYELN